MAEGGSEQGSYKDRFRKLVNKFLGKEKNNCSPEQQAKELFLLLDEAGPMAQQAARRLDSENDFSWDNVARSRGVVVRAQVNFDSGKYFNETDPETGVNEGYQFYAVIHDPETEQVHLYQPTGYVGNVRPEDEYFFKISGDKSNFGVSEAKGLPESFKVKEFGRILNRKSNSFMDPKDLERLIECTLDTKRIEVVGFGEPVALEKGSTSKAWYPEALEYDSI